MHLICYSLFKEKMEFENDFIISNDRDNIYTLQIPKFKSITPNQTFVDGIVLTVRRERKCSICKNGSIGVEYRHHYIYVCPTLEDSRKRVIPNTIISRHNAVNTKILGKPCNFIRWINSKTAPSSQP